MRSFRSLALAILCLALVAGPIQARTPTSGAGRYYAPGTQLTFRFSGGPPTSIQTAVRLAATDFSSPTWNNSRTPTFSYAAGGAGTVFYSSALRSPCGTNNTLWLQCASNWGSPNFRIFIRNLSGAPISNWGWCDIALVGTCYDAERAALHEMLHVVLGIGFHDPQGPSDTIMGPAAPAYPAFGWNTHHIQRCDQAAAQLLYGVASPYGKFADCFGSIPRHGLIGLVPDLSLSQPMITVCLNQPVVMSGRAAIAPISYAYKELANSPLAGRTVWFDRKPSTSSVWTLNFASATATAAAGWNWSRSFVTSASSPVTYQIRPHTDGETGVDASTGPWIWVTWRAC